METMYFDLYKWGSGTFSVIYTSRNARNALMERMERATSPIGERLAKLSAEQLRAMFPDQRQLIDGWERNVQRPGAMLALGLSAV